MTAESDAINGFKTVYETKATELNSTMASILVELQTNNATLASILSEYETLNETLSSMDQTQADYLTRASTESLGIYNRGIWGEISRALVMASISEEQLEKVRKELKNPTRL